MSMGRLLYAAKCADETAGIRVQFEEEGACQTSALRRLKWEPSDAKLVDKEATCRRCRSSLLVSGFQSVSGSLHTEQQGKSVAGIWDPKQSIRMSPVRNRNCIC